MPSASGPRLAVNPIAYWNAGTTADKSTANLGQRTGGAVGHRVHRCQGGRADRHATRTSTSRGWNRSAWRRRLSLFSGQFSDATTHQDAAEEARAFAAVQASFGQRFTHDLHHGEGAIRRDGPIPRSVSTPTLTG